MTRDPLLEQRHGGAGVTLTRNAPFEPAYTVTRDGQRFLITTITEESASVATKIVFNWPGALSRR